MTTRTLIRATAYVDTRDPHGVGWAYRLAYDDGHREMGRMDIGPTADRDIVLDELRTLVGNGWWSGQWYCTDKAGLSYTWTRDA